MWALYKKEIFSFFRSMTGYVYIGFFLLVAGIFFMAFNLQGGVAEFGYVLGNTTTVLLIVIPMLTMRLLCEEQKQKTDQLLLRFQSRCGRLFWENIWRLLPFSLHRWQFWYCAPWYCPCTVRFPCWNLIPAFWPFYLWEARVWLLGCWCPV